MVASVNMFFRSWVWLAEFLGSCVSCVPFVFLIVVFIVAVWACGD